MVGFIVMDEAFDVRKIQKTEYDYIGTGRMPSRLT